MEKWVPYPQDEHDAIVDQFRRQGWSKMDAEEESDIKVAERIKRRANLPCSPQ